MDVTRSRMDGARASWVCDGSGCNASSESDR